MATKSIGERFWAKVDKTSHPGGCWLWTGKPSTFGYGTLYCNGKNKPAHRASYELHHGTIPPGLFICHRCDNPTCVNPDHLFAGTQSDNMKDCVSKGRMFLQRHPDKTPKNIVVHRGEKHGKSKLTEAQVREIVSTAGPARVLAARFGVCESTVQLVRNGTVWSHVTGIKRPLSALEAKGKA